MRSDQDDCADILDLIGRVYDAALNPRLWPALAPEIARVFDSTSTGIATVDLNRGTVEKVALTTNLDSSAWDAYRAHYHQHDMWIRRGVQVGLSKVLASQDLIKDAELEGSEFYDFLRQVDAFYIVGAVFQLSRDKLGILGIHRPRQAGTYNKADKRRAAQLLPHLVKALQIQRRLLQADVTHSASADAVERLKVATLVVDAEGHLVYANGEAEILLNNSDGIRVLNGRITTCRGCITAELMSLIRTSVETSAGRNGTAGGVLTIPRRDRLPLSVMVAPFRPGQNNSLSQFPASILFIRDPERSTLATCALRATFGFTSAEANIASELAKGRSPDEIASSTGIKLSTLRTHLKRIFEKTGTNRQGELVAALLRTVAILGEP